MIAASASVLPPPPAHRSSTCSPGLAPAKSAASCEPSSWISIRPFRYANSACTAGFLASARSLIRRPVGDQRVGSGARSARDFAASSRVAFSAAAERVIDEAGDAGTIARAGEAVRDAPILQGVGCGPAPRANIGENFDRGGQPRAGCHYGNPSMILTMKISHMIISTSAPMPNREPRARRLLLVQWM